MKKVFITSGPDHQSKDSILESQHLKCKSEFLSINFLRAHANDL